MSIYKTAIDKPVTTLLIFVAVIVIGLFSLLRLPIDQFPELEPPYISVMTTYPGASASEVETNVTRLLENSLNSVDGLKELNSSSRDNMSLIFLELEWGTNLDEVINDIRSFIDMTKDNLPTGCSNPFIFKFSSSAMPIIQFAVTAEESYAGLDKILNDVVVPQLNRVDGIGNISISGAPERYVYVDLNQEKMDAYGIPLELVGAAISNNNLNLSSGTVKMEKEQYQLQVRTEYVESSEINDLVVTTTPTGKVVYIRDIASVRDTIKDLSLDEKINGRDGVRVIITKQSGANTVQICQDVNKEMEKVKRLLPADVEIDLIYDSSLDIQSSINSLEKSILYALIFVVLVVLFFLGKVRATLIIAITIPIALIVSFVYLAFVGSSLNIISLSSLTVAIGMVVDDAIVVLENIMRHIQRGSSPREAAKYATNEVWVSVIATTLVIVVVFLPLTMLGGLAGVMFKELGWIVTIVVSTSTIVAISLTPMLSSKLLKSKKVKVDEFGHIVDVQTKTSWYERYAIGLMDSLDKWYAEALRYCLRHKRITIAAVVLLFLGSLVPLAMGLIGTDFMQQTDSGRLSVTVELNRGTRIEETLKTARKLETRFMELVPEIRILSTSAGSNDEAGISALFSSTTNNTISMQVVCSKKYERERSIFEIAEVLRKEMALYPEIIDYRAQQAGFGMGANSTVDVEIYGFDFNTTDVLAETIKQTISDNVSGARDITISREEQRAELKIVVDKEKLAMHGLNSATVSAYVRNRVSGMLAGYLKEDGDEFNIIVRMEESNRNSITAIEDLTIPTPMGGKIKLREVASVEEYWSLPTISRKSRQRIVSVQVTPFETSLGELAVEIEKALEDVDVPQGVTIRMGGDYEEQQETFADMGLFMLLIIMLVYIVMASQFESFSKPFIIMMAVPFAITGVILALLVTGTSLDMIGALGAIMLVGIVVKNGIVLVDYINLMRDRGYELYEAISLAGASRLRPVLMTAFTTILGMLPMALSQGEGSEMWRPMGIVVIGGLLVSTFVTLIVVPVLYGIMSRHGERDKEEKARKEFVFLQLSEENNSK
ncbi:MAG TPA: efflux RND transporter permease subunit [Tenuifilaceae bacterium]|nr:efflux RND transporter permease subunit [Tenuifilaceae bacterium]HPE19523.1 efflux RND transporter permease subunit [Tenuifilaceae bacterium]HPJ47070.1 efflux RND transporter permease subunit [Tenuifilaceae bacterium]HPQ35602.1 efflux RND transporter permease subunit [Tenuifilaceae bacterium]HRX69328.1 efflux RND transporter permease subunit [Tenuifilaceae bacterium]